MKKTPPAPLCFAHSLFRMTALFVGLSFLINAPSVSADPAKGNDERGATAGTATERAKAKPAAARRKCEACAKSKDGKCEESATAKSECEDCGKSKGGKCEECTQKGKQVAAVAAKAKAAEARKAEEENARRSTALKHPAAAGQEQRRGEMRERLEKVRDEIMELRRTGDHEGANRKMDELRKQFAERAGGRGRRGSGAKDDDKHRSGGDQAHAIKKTAADHHKGDDHADRKHDHAHHGHDAKKGKHDHAHHGHDAKKGKHEHAHHGHDAKKGDHDHAHHGHDDDKKPATARADEHHPHRAAQAERAQHLHQAAAHLRAAGLQDDAHRIGEMARRVEEEARRAAGGDAARRIAELEEKIGDLEKKLGELQGEGTDPDQEIGEVVVNVRKDGTVMVNSNSITHDDLYARLRAIAEEYPDQAVIVRGDSGASWQAIADVLDTCRRAKVWNVAFATARAEDNEALQERAGNSKQDAKACEACAKAKGGKCEKCATKDGKCADCEKSKDGKCKKCDVSKAASKCEVCAKSENGKCEKCTKRDAAKPKGADSL